MRITLRRFGQAMLTFLISVGVSAQTQQPFDAAIAKGDIEAVKLLLDKGANANTRTQVGGTPLEAAANFGHAEIVRLLIAKGATVDSINARDQYTPLMRAAQQGHADVVEILLANGAGLNKRQSSGNTPVLLAAQGGHVDVVRLLVAHDADVNIPMRNGATALMWASRRGFLSVVEILLSKGAKANAVDDNGASALVAATEGGFTDVVQMLVAKGADVNIPASDGTTALMWAANKGNTAAIDILLKNGADVNSANKSGMTPLIAALRERHPEAARLLLSRGADPGLSGRPASLASSAGYSDIVKTIEDKVRAGDARLKERMQSLHRLRLSVSVPRMVNVTRQGNDRTINIDLTKDRNATDEHWTPLVRRAVEDAVSSFGVALVETGQDADLNVIFQGYSGFSPSPLQSTSEELFSASVLLKAPDLSSLHQYQWTIPFLSRQDVNNYSKYFRSSGEANETAVLADFREAVKADLTGVLPPPVPKTGPALKPVTSSPARQAPPAK